MNYQDNSNRRYRITTDAPRHKMSSKVSGNIATFHCEQCGKRVQVNLSTGAMKVLDWGQADALHLGMTLPAADRLPSLS